MSTWEDENNLKVVSAYEEHANGRLTSYTIRIWQEYISVQPNCHACGDEIRHEAYLVKTKYIGDPNIHRYACMKQECRQLTLVRTLLELPEEFRS